MCQCTFAGAVRAQLSHVVAPRVKLSGVLAQGVVEHAQQASASSVLPWTYGHVVLMLILMLIVREISYKSATYILNSKLKM